MTSSESRQRRLYGASDVTWRRRRGRRGRRCDSVHLLRVLRRALRDFAPRAPRTGWNLAVAVAILSRGCVHEPPHRAPHGFLLGTVSTRAEAAPEHHGGGPAPSGSRSIGLLRPVPQEDVQPHDLGLAFVVSMLAGKDLRVQAVQPSSGLEKHPHFAGRFAGRWVDAFVRLVSGELHPMVLLRHRSNE